MSSVVHSVPSVVELGSLHGPTPRSGHSATLVGSCLYVFGGASMEISYQMESEFSVPKRIFHATMYRYHLDSGRWDSFVVEDSVSGSVVPLPMYFTPFPRIMDRVGRHFHSCVHRSSDGCLYIFGGKSGRGYRNDLLCFDPTSNTFENVVVASSADSESECECETNTIDDFTIPTARWGHSAVVLPSTQSMFVFGGHDANGSVSRSLFQFVFSANRWRRIRLKSDDLLRIPRRFGHAMVSLQHLCPSDEITGFVIIGGRRGGGPSEDNLDDIWSFEIAGSELGVALGRVQEVKMENEEEGENSNAMILNRARNLRFSARPHATFCVFASDDLQHAVLASVRLHCVSEADFALSARMELVSVGGLAPQAYLPYGSASYDPNSHRIVLFGGQTKLKVLPTPASLPTLFRGRAANLLHACPDEVLLIVLGYLDASSLCAVRASSSRWSPSLLAADDSLWGPLFDSLPKVDSDTISDSDEATQSLSPKARYAALRLSEFEWLNSTQDAFVGQRLSIRYLYSAIRPEDFKQKVKDWDSSKMIERDRPLKTVFIGDGAVGKTCLLYRLCSGEFPEEYVPTVFDNYTYTHPIAGKVVPLSVWDTAGEEDYDELRPLSYTDLDSFVICYSCVNPVSFANIRAKWIPEIQRHERRASRILVATKMDLREDSEVMEELMEWNRRGPITTKEGLRLAKDCGCDFFLETSALEGTGVLNLFRTVFSAGLMHRYPEHVRATRTGRLKPRCGVM